MSERIDIVTPAIARYLDERRAARDPFLERLESEAEAEGWPIVSRASADLLEVLVRALKPERALEIGTAIGYSGAVIARAMQPWGHLDTIEIDPETAERARANFAEAGLSGRVTVHKGDARQVLMRLENRYDFVFLDAAKEVYADALRLALPLMPKGAVIAVDNLLWSGRVLGEPAPDDASTAALRAFNEMFVRHPAISATILPVGDGLGVGVRV